MFKLQNLLRAGQGKAIKRYDAIISRINEFEKETGRLSDYDIKGKKAQFHLRYEKGETPVSYTHLDVYKRQ